MSKYWIIAVAVASTVAWAAPGEEIVWPEYTQVSKPIDVRLTCPELAAEIGHVDADLDLLRHAKAQAEDAMRVVRDMRSPSGLAMADTSSFKTSGRGVEYAETRSQIKQSQRIAKARREYLEGLQSSCREPTKP